MRARALLRREPALPVRQRQRGCIAAAQPLRRPAARTRTCALALCARAHPPRALRGRR